MTQERSEGGHGDAPLVGVVPPWDVDEDVGEGPQNDGEYSLTFLVAEYSYSTRKIGDMRLVKAVKPGPPLSLAKDAYPTWSPE